MNPPQIDEIIKKIHLTKINPTINDRLYIFGRNPELSLAEIISCYNGIDEKVDILDISRSGVICKSEARSSKDKHISISNCGSVLKRCKPIAILKKNFNIDDVKPILIEYFKKEIYDDKFSWTISSYNESKSQNKKFNQIYESIRTEAKQGLKTIKLKKAYYFRPKTGTQAAPNRLNKKKILQTGFELIIWHRKDDIILCVSEEIIDIDTIAKRDSERPNKRPLLLLGLALARTMVNLVSVEKNRYNLPVYDPFCGMGSIISEAYLLGLKGFGSDIDKSCVERSKGNLIWLSEKKKNKKKFGVFPEENFFRMDIISPAIPKNIVNKFKEIDSDRFDNKNKNKDKKFQVSIVAEPNLLTPLKNYPTKNKALDLVRVFEQNYADYLYGINQILPVDGICVLIFPRIRTIENQRISLNINDLLGNSKLNFKICNITVNYFNFPAHFIHSWKNPIIEREIIVFKKTH